MDTLRELAQVYDELEGAFLAQDFDAITLRVDPGWHGAMAGDSISRDQMLSHVREQFSKWEAIEWHREISNLRWNGNEATVLAAGEYRAWERASGKPVSMHLANDDTWRKDSKGWKLVRSENVESQQAS
jgi:hypothetical protein